MVDSYKNLQDVPILLWAIPSDEFLHPCVTDICLLFIKDIVSKKTYFISFNHPDLITADNNKNDIVHFLERYSPHKWVFDKKSFLQLLPIKGQVEGLLDINLWNHLHTGEIIDRQLIDTNAHKFIYRSKRKYGDLNKVIPLVKHKELFEKMCDEFFKMDTSLVGMEVGFQKENEIILESLSELEANGIYVNADCFSQYFDVKIHPNGLMYSQYNIYTSAGRPSNHFDGINYAALNKDNGVRKCFSSRHGDDGTMVLIDYSAFHPRIISNLVGFNISADEDIYKYLGELYFNREITEYDIDEIKSITMRQLYGEVEEKYRHINYLISSRQFINDNWKNFERDGYVLTPIFTRPITTDHLKDANPNKLFNYILQATETEITMTVVRRINHYLRTKKTKAVLYTYDSLLFDFHRDDGQNTLTDIMTIMKINDRFPIKVYAGQSYDSVIQIYP